MYSEMGPWWYTAWSVMKVNGSPAAMGTVTVLAPELPPALHRRSLDERLVTGEFILVFFLRCSYTANFLEPTENC